MKIMHCINSIIFFCIVPIAIGMEPERRRLSIWNIVYDHMEQNNTPITPIYSDKECDRLLAHVKHMIDHGEDLNEKSCIILCGQTQTRATPLMKAASYGYLNIVQLLLENKADVEISGTNGTALHIAVKQNHESCANLLLQHGANPNTHKYLFPPLFYALFNNNLQLARTLLTYQANPKVLIGAYYKVPIFVKIVKSKRLNLKFKKQAIYLLLGFGAEKSYIKKTQTISIPEHARSKGFHELADII